MKNLKYFFSFFCIAILLGCSEENDTNFINDASAPTDISALFTITHDNTGKVTILPNGSGVTYYVVDFADSSLEKEELNPGEFVTHTYLEGVYDVKITAFGINGRSTVLSQQLTVSYVAPENVTLTVTPEPGNPYKINVSAEADFETYFDVYFGDVANEVPVQFNQGQTIVHTYSAIGTYTVRLVAYSGGAATTERTQVVTVYDPVLLPIDFESQTLNYAFTNFGNATSTVVGNPSVSGINMSAKVGRLTKNAGAEVWAGSYLELGEPIDFSSLHQISVKTFSPVAGITVKLKLENLADPNINTEVDVTNTVANQWETLTFDLSSANFGNSYQRVVLFFDFGNSGNGANYYFDDIQLSSSAPDVNLVTFQDVAYSFTDFGRAATTVIDNPHATGINTSSKVAKLNKTAGAETWAGSFLEMAAPIDFSQHTKVKVKTWSPQAGIIVKLKFENFANANINIERDAVTTVSNGWEELTYDFTGIVNANNYQRVVMFFDFGNPGTGADYYFDDIKLSN